MYSLKVSILAPPALEAKVLDYKGASPEIRIPS